MAEKLSKKAKAADTRKKAELQKAKKKVARGFKGSAAAAVTTGSKGKSIIGQGKKKK